MPADPILQLLPLGFPWQTIDPFLFCVHHDDAYPRGNARHGPDASLAGRTIGNDFAGIDGWRMYHGDVVPGFPSHPHRGFETVTIVRRGLIDHSDSLGAAARFGEDHGQGGDVQWLTAGAGIVHAEMFPLLSRDAGNPIDFFQIWLNLPAASKMAPPHFTMFWAEDIPRLAADGVEVVVIAGAIDGAAPPLAPPPDSWAARADADLAMWTIRLAPGSRWTLPPAAAGGTRRRLYFHAGSEVVIGGRALGSHAAADVAAGAAVDLANRGRDAVELLLLQGRPIGEPVAQYGPFVMNTQAELRQAFADYQRTGFGGWPWDASGPVHGGAAQGRFARHADGRLETRGVPAAA